MINRKTRTFGLIFLPSPASLFLPAFGVQVNKVRLPKEQKFSLSHSWLSIEGTEIRFQMVCFEFSPSALLWPTYKQVCHEHPTTNMPDQRWWLHHCASHMCKWVLHWVTEDRISKYAV